MSLHIFTLYPSVLRITKHSIKWVLFNQFLLVDTWIVSSFLLLYKALQ